MPMNAPAAVSVCEPTCLAMPKSSTCAVPSGSDSMTLSGFVSRWTMPRSSASSSERATWAAMRSARAGSSGPPRSDSRSVSPSTKRGDEEVAPLVEPGVEQRHGVRRAQQGGDVRLAIEAIPERLVGREVGMQQLDRDAGAVARVGRLVDGAHAAAAQQVAETVVGDDLRCIKPVWRGWGLLNHWSPRSAARHLRTLRRRTAPPKKRISERNGHRHRGYPATPPSAPASPSPPARGAAATAPSPRTGGS